MTIPTQAQIEALELIDTFAWSCVKTDCEESLIELQRRIRKCHAALKADVRFREFGNGATWVDLPMTQETSDILHKLKVREPCMIDMDGVRPAKANRPQYIILDIKERDEIVAALTAAAAEAGEQRACATCGAILADGPQPAFTYAAAAEVGEKEKHDAQVDRYVTLGNAMKMQTIERCAQVAENFPSTGSRSIAAAIRAMKEEG